jgi:hypothetical protein
MDRAWILVVPGLNPASLVKLLCKLLDFSEPHFKPVELLGELNKIK